MYNFKPKCGILTISDSCFRKEKEDKSGACLAHLFTEAGFDIFDHLCVADDYESIKNVLTCWSDDIALDVIVTTGGTGFTAKDVTPEATKAVIERSADGLTIALISESLKSTKMAMLSRLVCGIRKSTLIINLPGSVKACQECFTIIEPVLNHAVNQLRDDMVKVHMQHNEMQESKKPHLSNMVEEDLGSIKNLGFHHRSSPYPMIDMNQAMSIIVEHVDTLSQIETLSISDSKALIGRRIANNIESSLSLPPFSASIKDGYAVNSADGKGERRVIPLSITAGIDVEDIVLERGWCARINTGAPIPEGADAVVQVENTEVIERYQDGNERYILIKTQPYSGQDIRPFGSDIKEGDTLIRKGTKLGPIELGLIASVGLSQVTVRAKPRVAVLSTGNELREPGEALSFGQIWDSNRVMPIKDRGLKYDLSDL